MTNIVGEPCVSTDEMFLKTFLNIQRRVGSVMHMFSFACFMGCISKLGRVESFWCEHSARSCAAKSKCDTDFVDRFGPLLK